MAHLAAPYARPTGESQSAIYLGDYFNLGFAVELYLKAFLRDVTGEEVFKYGHDLDSLLKAVLANGFSLQEFAMTYIVTMIGPKHRALRFRYAEGANGFSQTNQLDFVEATLAACCEGMAHLR